MTIRSACCIALALLVMSCASHKQLLSQLRQTESDLKEHIGFVLYDPATKEIICNHQGDRYFTPASNAKIFTLFASLVILGDSVPALRYAERGDSLIFWGTGDPGFLYQNISPSGRCFDFIKNHPGRLFFSTANFHSDRFGPGWAWDDYLFTFQVEKTPLPIYGNRVTVKRQGNVFSTTPSVPVRSIPADSILESVSGSRGLSFEVPFHSDDKLLASLLSDTLKREVTLVRNRLNHDAKTLYSAGTDSLYSEMMQESDNFIAEQLLLVCSGILSDSLKSEITIDYMRKNFFSDFPDKPQWVDGSGLSRYNLFTPETIVKAWEKMIAIVPRERLFSLLAAGGERGTLKNYYKAEKPFIFGKTGTFGNNHSLSGFLVTKQDRTLIFSWMNNNFTAPTAEVRARMEIVLKNIYEKY